MQLKNWNDLRYLLAIKRGSTVTAAARLLSVDDTTVSRRLAALQVASGSTLFTRQPDGKLRLTASGDAIAQRAEIMERQVDLVNEGLGAGHGQYAGSVKLTSVPILAKLTGYWFPQSENCWTGTQHFKSNSSPRVVI
jgi:DNA-binding transcriptional LysR family regulator